MRHLPSRVRIPSSAPLFPGVLRGLVALIARFLPSVHVRAHKTGVASATAHSGARPKFSAAGIAAPSLVRTGHDRPPLRSILRIIASISVSRPQAALLLVPMTEVRNRRAARISLDKARPAERGAALAGHRESDRTPLPTWRKEAWRRPTREGAMNEATHPNLRRAIEHLAANCDGARERDTVGFSKADAAYGHRMAVELELRDLDGAEQIVIREILVKYTSTQLEKSGIHIPAEAELREWLGPEWSGVDAGTETRSRVLDRLRRAENDRKPKPAELTIETSPYSPDLLFVRIGRKEARFYDILTAIKSLPRDDREYRAGQKVWAVEGNAAARLADALGEFRINWTESALAVRDRALAAPKAVASPDASGPIAPGVQGNVPAQPEPDVTLAISGSLVLVAFGGCTRERMFNFIASVKAIPGARFQNFPTKHWELPIDRAKDVLGAFPDAAGAVALRAYLLSLDAGEAQAEAARLERLSRLNASLDARIAGPAVGHTLRAFQVEGIRFVFDCLDRDGARGALVADDMGLGKTLEALVIADELRREHGAAIFALTKASCLDNWSIEAAREKIPAEIFSHDFRKIPEPLESGKYVVLIDEAHSFKNIASRKTAALLKLVEHPNCVAAIPLSGTLNENGRPVEFFVPLRVINHELGRDEKAFKKRYCNASTTAIKHKRFGRIDHERQNAAGAAHLVELHRRIKPYFLRRLKTEPDIGIELPDKTRIFQEWSPTPEVDSEYRRELGRLRDIYETRVAESEMRRAQAAVLRATVEQERTVGNFGVGEWVAWATTAEPPVEGAGASVLEAARRSNAIGDDTLSREPVVGEAREIGSDRGRLSAEDADWALDVARELMSGTISPEGAALVALTHARHAASRAKISSAIELTDELLSQDRRPVVFFDFADTAKAFAEHYGVPCLTGESGSVGRDGELGERQQMCEDFNEGRHSVFVGTIKAGGEGLNLTGGSDCLLVDRAWTPGKAVQAEDRIWRIGQTRNVFSFWVQAFGIDKQIDERLILKQSFIETMYTGEVKTLEGVEISALAVLDSVLREIEGRGVGSRSTSRPRLESADGALSPGDHDTIRSPKSTPAQTAPTLAVELAPVVAPVTQMVSVMHAESTPCVDEVPSRAELREPEKPSPQTGSDLIVLEGLDSPFAPGLAAIVASPRLLAPRGAESLDAFLLREQYPHPGGTLAVLENPVAHDGSDDRLALLNVRCTSPGICQITTLFVADGEGNRFAFRDDCARVALPDPAAVREGQAVVPDEYPKLLESVRSMVPELERETLLGRLVDFTCDAPVGLVASPVPSIPVVEAAGPTAFDNNQPSSDSPSKIAQLGFGF